MDGGIKHNNPAPEAWHEVQEIIEATSAARPSPDSTLLISIGSGKVTDLPATSFLARIPWIGRRVIRFAQITALLTETYPSHRSMLRATKDTKNLYFRFDGPALNIKLDQWNKTTRNVIEKETELYLKSPDISKSMKDCADSLVNIWQSRR